MTPASAARADMPEESAESQLEAVARKQKEEEAAERERKVRKAFSESLKGLGDKSYQGELNVFLRHCTNALRSSSGWRPPRQGA